MKNIFFPIFLFLCSCTSTQVVSPQISFVNNTTLTFTGRGSAAAFMLDGLLDGGGMAVGIAIDQGIAKDIAANLNSLPQGFSMQNLVQAQWKKAAAELNKTSSHSKKNILTNTKIVIHSFGFRTAIGESDKVTPWLKLEFIHDGSQKFLEFPGDTQESLLLNFDQVKVDALKANTALERATYQLIQQFLSRHLGSE